MIFCITRFLPTLLLLLLGVSCSGKFQREWDAAAVRPVSTGAIASTRAGATGHLGHPLEGRWEGRWQSIPSGHSGELRCIVTAQPRKAVTHEQKLNFHYHARWAKVFSGAFRLQCPVEEKKKSTFTWSGEMNLGKTLGGTFSHQAEGGIDSFVAKYQAMGDHGEFRMHRVK